MWLCFRGYTCAHSNPALVRNVALEILRKVDEGKKGVINASEVDHIVEVLLATIWAAWALAELLSQGG